jgi:hypothetical protein
LVFHLEVPLAKNGKPDSAGNKLNGNGHAAPQECLRLGRDCDYEKELRRLQVELVKLQEWVRHKGLKVDCAF